MIKSIAIIGTHGVGKTTLAYQLCSFFKQKQFNVKLLHEAARSCPFPINEEANEESELFIFHRQILEELKALAEGYDFFISDRSTLDPFVYYADRTESGKHFRMLMPAALEWMNRYNLIILVEPNEHVDSFAIDAVRSSSIEYRNRIRDLFRLFVKKLPKKAKEKLVIVKSDEIFQDFTLTPAVHAIANKLNEEFHQKETPQKKISKPATLEEIEKFLEKFATFPLHNN